MAYADQQGMSTGRLVSIILVLLIHVGIGYALVTGLAYEAVQNVRKQLEVIDIEEEKPPEEEPPPPPEEVVIVPPPAVAVKTPAPTKNKSTRTTENTEKKEENKQPTTKTCPDGSTVAFTAACPQVDRLVNCPGNTRGPGGARQVLQSQLSTCREPERDLSAPAKPRNNRARWVTTNDYPTRDLNRGNEGTTRITLTVGANGRATACTVSGSSGHSGLDRAACRRARSRARFTPAKDKRGNPTTGTYTTSVRWQIPK